MSKGISSAAFVLFAAVCIFAGCSIKEDRSQCPCILELDFSGNGRFDRLDFGVSSGDDFLYRDMVGNRDFGQPYRLEVPRSGVYLNVYSFASSDGRADGYGGGAAVMGETEFIDSDRTSLTIPLGRECPPVYMYSSRIDTGKEMHSEYVLLRKNYSVLFIRLLSESASPLVLAVGGKIDGYGLDGAPEEGDFYVKPEVNEDGYCEVRIPRQKDGALRLTISDEEGVLREFALGEYIIASGYDWTAADLEDVEMVIDYAKTGVVFSIKDLEKTVTTEVVI